VLNGSSDLLGTSGQHTRDDQDDPEERRRGREVGGRAAAADPHHLPDRAGKSLDQMLYKRASAGHGFYKTMEGKFGLTELRKDVVIDDVPLSSTALV
jgi:hypothetical protein